MATATGTSRSTHSSSSKSSLITTLSSPPRARGRARDFGIPVGFLPTGTHNAITDVPGVRVGHQTVWKGDYSPSPSGSFPTPHAGSGDSPSPLVGEGRGGGSQPVIRSGVT